MGLLDDHNTKLWILASIPKGAIALDIGRTKNPASHIRVTGFCAIVDHLNNTTVLLTTVDWDLPNLRKLYRFRVRSLSPENGGGYARCEFSNLFSSFFGLKGEGFFRKSVKTLNGFRNIVYFFTKRYFRSQRNTSHQRASSRANLSMKLLLSVYQHSVTMRSFWTDSKQRYTAWTMRINLHRKGENPWLHS